MLENINNDFKITVAIPCYNNEDSVGRAIEAALNQSRAPDEIIVVDDGSTDNSRVLIDKYPVRLFAYDINRGLAFSRNIAFRHARGNIIVYVDADTVPHPNLIEVLLKKYNHRKIGGVGGQGVESRVENIFDLWRKIFWPQTHGHTPIVDDWMLMGLCCSYRREVLEKVGGFREIYKTNAEDVDIGIRIRKLGYRLVYTPEAKVDHQRSDGFRSLITQVYRHSYWQSFALKINGKPCRRLLCRAGQWLFITTISSIKTHKNLGLACISPPLCLAGIAGTLRGAL